MTQNQRQNGEDMTLESLEAQLRRLPEVEVPEALEARLLAAIPHGVSHLRQQSRLGWWPGALGIGAAAAFLILVFVFVANYAPSTGSGPAIIEPNDRSRYFLADQNSEHIGNAEPCGLQGSIVSQNEPPYRN